MNGLGQALPYASSSAGNPIMTTDPTFIAQAQAVAVQNGMDPSVVDQMAASGADEVQIAQAVTQIPGTPGPQTLISTLGTEGQLATQLDQLQSGVAPASTTFTSTTGLLSWFEQNWYWFAGGAALLLLIVLMKRK